MKCARSMIINDVTLHLVVGDNYYNYIEAAHEK
jgi:hypothetical protein